MAMATETRGNRSTAQRLIDRLVSGPLGQKVLQEEQAEVSQERAALLAAIEASEAALRADLPKLDKELAASMAELERADRAFKAAQAALGAAHQKRRARSYQATFARDQALRKLERLAPESEIKAFREFLFAVDAAGLARARTAPMALPALPPRHEHTAVAYTERDEKFAAAARLERGRIDERKAEIRAEMETARFLAQPDAAIAKQLEGWRRELGG